MAPTFHDLTHLHFSFTASSIWLFHHHVCFFRKNTTRLLCSLQDPQSDPSPLPPPTPKFLFLNFHKIFNSLFTSTLTPQPDPPDPPPPPQISFFEFSQKLQSFFIHIHPDPPTRPPNPTPPPTFFFLIFIKTSLLCSHLP